MQNEIAELFNKIISGLNDATFSEALSKWRVKIFSCVQNVSKMTKVEEVEILSNLISKLVEVNITHKKDLFRYKGHVYEISDKDGSLVQIKSISVSKDLVNTFWTMDCNITPVKKASLSSMIFREIHQFKCDYLTSFYSLKNGYKVIEKEGYDTQSKRINTVKKLLKNC